MVQGRQEGARTVKRRKTSATPAGVSRSRSYWTRAERKQIKQNCLDVQAMNDAYAALYGDDDERDYEPSDEGECQECGGLGFIQNCPDDLCQGEHGCIHGDGDETCPECGGH